MPSASNRSNAIVAVLVLAAALRLWGLGFGFPIVSNFYVRPDESLIVQAALLFFERNGDPQFFAYPALLVELSAILFAGLAPWFGDFGSNPSPYFLTVRALSATAGTATVAVVYLLGRQWCSHRWALCAAAFYAVAPLPVRDAHFGVTDTLMTFLVAATLLAAVRYSEAEESSNRLWFWSAVLFGLAVSTKYTAFLVCPALLASALAHRDGGWRRASRRLSLAAISAALIFAVLNPYVILQAPETMGTLAGMFRVFYGGAQALPESEWTWQQAAAQLLRPLLWAPVSWMALLLAGIGLLRIRSPKQLPPGILPLAFGVLPFLLALLPFRHPLPFRYLLPALPGLTVLAVYVASRLTSRKSMELPVALAAAGLILGQLTLSVALVATLAKEDTRTLAGHWLEQRLPKHIPVVLLTTPEAEPQLKESAASLDRRIAYVYQLYGEHSGRIVSELYRLIRIQAGTGYDVYRNPAPGEVPGDECLVVLSGYPMRTAGEPAEGRLKDFGATLERVEFNPIEGEMRSAALDASDAFFLPMNPWGRVARPGPRLLLVRVRRAASP